MPATYLRPFRVRHYECDAASHLYHANYLRYMETAAFEASTDVGYTPARYDALGLVWLVYESAITYRRPILYGATVQVKTWVEDFRRVRSRRRYEFFDPQTGALLADGCTDWVLLDRESQRPVSIPAALRQAFFPEGVPPDAGRAARFPEPPAPPAGVFTTRRHVEWRDVDPARHVNNAVYLSYMESSAMGLMRHCGWTMQRAWDSGFAIVARDYRIEYRGQATLDDELQIDTWLSDVRRATAVRHYRVTRVADGAVLTRGRCLYAWVDPQTYRPVRISREFLTDFQANISAGKT